MYVCRVKARGAHSRSLDTCFRFVVDIPIPNFISNVDIDLSCNETHMRGHKNVNVVVHFKLCSINLHVATPFTMSPNPRE
jgi:hypothetical protein